VLENEQLQARARGAGSLVAIEFKQASCVQRARGVPQVEVTRALVNPMGAVHINKPAVSAADRVLVERFVRTMPFRFSEADKFVNEDVVDTCCQLVARPGERRRRRATARPSLMNSVPMGTERMPLRAAPRRIPGASLRARAR
jgi:hypothetical protein